MCDICALHERSYVAGMKWSRDGHSAAMEIGARIGYHVLARMLTLAGGDYPDDDEVRAVCASFFYGFNERHKAEWLLYMPPQCEVTDLESFFAGNQCSREEIEGMGSTFIASIMLADEAVSDGKGSVAVQMIPQVFESGDEVMDEVRELMHESGGGPLTAREKRIIDDANKAAGLGPAFDEKPAEAPPLDDAEARAAHEKAERERLRANIDKVMGWKD